MRGAIARRGICASRESSARDLGYPSSSSSATSASFPDFQHRLGLSSGGAPSHRWPRYQTQDPPPNTHTHTPRPARLLRRRLSARLPPALFRRTHPRLMLSLSSSSLPRCHTHTLRSCSCPLLASCIAILTMPIQMQTDQTAWHFRPTSLPRLSRTPCQLTTSKQPSPPPQPSAPPTRHPSSSYPSSYSSAQTPPHTSPPPCPTTP